MALGDRADRSNETEAGREKNRGSNSFRGGMTI
jgi:hypothetical protein